VPELRLLFANIVITLTFPHVQTFHAPWLLRAAKQFCDGRVTLRSYRCWKSIYRHASVVTNKMLSYRRETALQGAL